MIERIRKYAEGTSVTIKQSRDDIENVLKKHGAGAFAFYSLPGRAVIMFEAHHRKLRFDLPLPPGDTERDRREQRRLYRSLYLVIKARLDAVTSGIETFEEAFLSHVVMPNDETVYQHAAPLIEISYKGGTMQPLLPAPRKP